MHTRAQHRRACKEQERLASLFDEALPIIVEQPELIHDHMLICKLLATSRKVAAVVMELCHHQLFIAFPHRPGPTVNFDIWEQQREMKQWLRKYDCLVSEMFVELVIFDYDSILNFELLVPLLQRHKSIVSGLRIIFWDSHLRRPFACKADMLTRGYPALDLALAMAAGTRRPAFLPYLHSFFSNTWPTSIIRQLPIGLLCLSLNLDLSPPLLSAGLGGAVDSNLAALTHLTNLRQLEIMVQQVPANLVHAFTSMVALTSLELTRDHQQHWSRLQQLQHLPQQLCELTFAVYDDERAVPVDISHLTALTRLNLMDTLLKEFDVLSPNVRILTAGITDDWGPVLHLQHLRELTVLARGNTSAYWLQELEQLHGLQQLTALTLQGGRFRHNVEVIQLLLARLLPQLRQLHAVACQFEVEDASGSDSGSDSGSGGEVEGIDDDGDEEAGGLNLEDPAAWEEAAGGGDAAADAAMQEFTLVSEADR
eukprot:gene6778-6995_t